MIAIAQPSVASSKPELHDSDLVAPSELVGSSRILFVGAGSEPATSMSDRPALIIGRAADLEGRSLTLVVKPGSTLKLGGGSAKRDLLPQTSSRRVTSGYGLRWDPLGAGWRAHAGVDLAAAYGSPVVASANGRVSAARWQGGYGLLVALDHGAGVETRYGHLSQLSVQEGQVVKKGDVIGYVGSTGRSTGPHLHYEVREGGRAVDPITSR
ncbi:peptidoglycan DD-metalloendopeptidase family protein [Novosphingobium ginsenosidimutans]